MKRLTWISSTDLPFSCFFHSVQLSGKIRALLRRPPSCSRRERSSSNRIACPATGPKETGKVRPELSSSLLQTILQNR